MKTIRSVRSTVFNLLLLVIVVGLVAACDGPDERKAMYRSRAQEYVQQGNYPKARVALRNALKIDPKDIESWFLFAQVEEQEQNWRNAYGDYLRVVELKPDHEAALIKLGKIYLEGRAYHKSIDIADKLLSQHPGHVHGQALHIAAEAATNKSENALQRAEMLFREHPNVADVAMLLASLYSSYNRLNDSILVLQNSLASQPTHPELLNALASTYLRSGQMADAQRTFLQIVKSNPNSFEHRLRLAGFYDQQQDYAKAEAVLREAVRLDPENHQRLLSLADYVATRRGAAQGEQILGEAIRQQPRATILQFALGRLYERSRQFEQARSVYRTLADDHKSKPVGWEALSKIANLDWETGNEAEAMEHLASVLRENPRSSDALLLQGRIALRQGRGKDAVQSLRTVLRDQPTLAEAQALLGQSYLILGETSLARESLDQATRLNPRQFEAHVVLANLDMVAGRRKEARARLEQVLALDPNNVGILGLLLTMQTSEKDWAGSADTVARLRSSGAHSLISDLAEGYLHQSRQEQEKAMAAFERAAEAAPDSPEPLMALIRLEMSVGHLPQARQRLESLLATKPSHLYAHGLLGELMLLAHDDNAAERHFENSTRINPEWITPWVNLAGMQFARNRSDAAQQILRKGIAANPSGEILRVVLATSLSETNHIDEAIGEYRTILEHNPRAIVAANNLASLLAEYKADSKSLEQALALSRDFEKTAPNPLFLDTLAWIHHKMGHRDEAVRVIKEAVARAPDHPVLNYHAGVVYHQAGLAKEAKLYLEKAVRSGKAFPGDKEARTLLETMTS